MKKIGIIVNKDKDPGMVFTEHLCKTIDNYGGKAVHLTADNIQDELNNISDSDTYGGKALHLTADNSPDELNSISDSDTYGGKAVHLTADNSQDELNNVSDCEIVVCLGGDGTFLSSARKIYRYHIPLLGINLGNLGFLTEVEKSDMENAVRAILEGKYSIEKRIMLDTYIYRDDKRIAKDTALNDVVISRGALSRILHVKTYIDNMFMDHFPGDGLIISTPSGSTAYNLSAGGPIVEPDANLIIVTPICPHILYSRSLITRTDRTISAVINENRSHGAMVTIDGQVGYECLGGDMIKTMLSKEQVLIARIGDRNFYNVLRKKTYLRGEIREEQCEIPETFENTRAY